MFNVRLAGDHLYGKWLFIWLSLMMFLNGLILWCPFSHEMFWMRSGTESSQFLKIIQPTFKNAGTILFSTLPFNM